MHKTCINETEHSCITVHLAHQIMSQSNASNVYMRQAYSYEFWFTLSSSQSFSEKKKKEEKIPPSITKLMETRSVSGQFNLKTETVRERSQDPGKAQCKSAHHLSE